MNCFSGQSIKCGHCSDIERTSRGHDTATQYPEPSSPFSFGGISSAKDEYSKTIICLICCKKKPIYHFTGCSNECNDCSHDAEGKFQDEEDDNVSFDESDSSENDCSKEDEENFTDEQQVYGHWHS